MLNPILIKAIASVAGGLIAVIALKVEDKFYNRQFETPVYVKMFCQGMLAGFCSIILLDIITNYLDTPGPVTVNLSGGGSVPTITNTTSSSIQSPTSAFQQFRFNNGTPSF